MKSSTKPTAPMPTIIQSTSRPEMDGGAPPFRVPTE